MDKTMIIITASMIFLISILNSMMYQKIDSITTKRVEAAYSKIEQANMEQVESEQAELLKRQTKESIDLIFDVTKEILNN